MGVPELDTQVGGMNVAVGPKDLTSPAAPPATPNNIPSAPPAAPPAQGAPQAPPAPQPQQGQGGQPAAPQEDPVEALFNKAGLGTQSAAPAEEPEAPFLQRVRSAITEDIQKIEAKFKMGVARNPNEQKTALEQVFGADNVKFSNGKIQIRPEGQKTFKSWSPEAFTMYAMPIATLVGKEINEMPENAGRLAGMVAQGGTQAVGSIGGALLGAQLGYPKVGAAVGGFLGGFFGSKAKKEVDQGMNQVLGQADPSYHYENNIATVGDAINNDWVQGTFGAGLAAYGVHSSVKAATDAELANRVGDTAAARINELNSGKGLTREQTGFSKFVSALRNYKEQFFPAVETEGTRAGLSAGQDAMGVAEKNMSELGAHIGLLNDKASALQKSKSTPGNPVYLKPSEFTQYVRSQLEKHGVEFTDDGFVDRGKTEINPSFVSNPTTTTANSITSSGLVGDAPFEPPPGRLVNQPIASSTSKPSVSAPSNIRVLMDMNDEALKAQNYSENHGLTVGKTQQFIDTLGNYADYEKAHPSPNSSEVLFRDARSALSSDRVSHYNQLFDGENSIESQLFKQVMGEYSQKKASLDIIRQQFNDPGKISLFAKKLTASGSANALNGVDAFKHILGENSPEWGNLKSALIGNIMDVGANNDKINASAVAGFLGNKDNQPLLNKLFNGDQKPIGVLKSILGQGEELQTSNNLSAGGKGAINRLIGFASNHMKYGDPIVKTLSKLTGNNVSSINYASEALIDAYKTAVSSEQKDAMLNQIKELNQFKAGAKIVEVPIKVGAGDKVRYIKRYLPRTAMIAATNSPVPDPEALSGAQSNNDKLNEIMAQPSPSQPAQ